MTHFFSPQNVNYYFFKGRNDFLIAPTRATPASHTCNASSHFLSLQHYVTLLIRSRLRTLYRTSLHLSALYLHPRQTILVHKITTLLVNHTPPLHTYTGQIHNTTSHFITLLYTTQTMILQPHARRTPLHYTILHNTTLHHTLVTLHNTRQTHNTMLHYISIPLHHTTPRSHYITPHYLTLHHTTLHTPPYTPTLKRQTPLHNLSIKYYDKVRSHPRYIHTRQTQIPEHNIMRHTTPGTLRHTHDPPPPLPRLSLPLHYESSNHGKETKVIRRRLDRKERPGISMNVALLLR